jgi:hypothetical protein
MNSRMPGFYWVEWSHLVDADVADRWPTPLIGEWDGKRWWFARMQTYRFDCEVKVLGQIAPQQRAA